MTWRDFPAVVASHAAVACSHVACMQAARSVRVAISGMLLDLFFSSSFDRAGQRLTPHGRTLEVSPGRINTKLELNNDYDVKVMILNYYSVCW